MLLGGALLGVLAVMAPDSAAMALDPGLPAGEQLLPGDFFQTLPKIGNTGVAVTAKRLTYNANAHNVVADGNVEVLYQGYDFTGDHLVFDQRAHTAHFIGNVVVRSPDGTVFRAPNLRLSSAMHNALMQQLTITTKGGALITAGDGEFQTGDHTILRDSTYAPCGRCIDAKGHRIGWSAKSVRMVYDNKTENVTLEQPSLYLLGVPVAWLPWLSMPDPSKRLNRLLTPSIDYSEATGGMLSLPYFIAAGTDTDIILTPTLMSRQGLMMAGEWDQRFPNGRTTVKVSGVYQRDPAAFDPYVGASHTFRGAIQSYGVFEPIPEWTVGWSYTAFTDPAYFTDYRINEDKSATNEVFATKLARNEFFDFRVQQFNLLGDVTEADAVNGPARQGLALPNTRYHNVLYLPHDMGELDLNADLLGVRREADDDRGHLNGVPYDFGRQETKAHGTVELDWQKRWIAPGGFVATPFIGLRADAAYADFYNGNLAAGPATHEQLSLFNATPIAAMDVRFPLVARTGWATHVVEPIVQLVYRGSDVTDVGITNDNAQSFVLEDTNLFSYNRFSGTDRQETGLRANVGGHYQVNFDNGGWLDILGGESFQLAGVNAFAQPDPTQVSTGQGMTASNSYMVLGAQGSVIPGLVTGAKLQYDPGGRGITRAGVGGTYGWNGYDFSADYLFLASNPERGVPDDQQEVAAGVSLPVPLIDYWRLDTHGAWDLSANSWLAAGAGLHYDDGYLQYGVDVEATGPTNTTANDLRITTSFRLKGLGGVD